MSFEANKKRIIQRLYLANALESDILQAKANTHEFYKIAKKYGIPKYMPIKSFKTHKGDIVEGEKLKEALNYLADFWESNAKAIHKEDGYASHVTEETKDLRLEQGLAYAREVRLGHIEDFTSQQRLNTYLTGECIALLPK